MSIGKAQALKKGQSVRFPTDRGDKAGTTKVRGCSKSLRTNYFGKPYIWVYTDNGTWPSNRL
jgi:hypothetical protein